MTNPTGDSTITGLPAAAVLTGLENFVFDQAQAGILITVRATLNQVSAYLLTSGLATVNVPTGGTGRNTLTNHGVLVGAGVNPITQLAVGTTGQILLGVTGADPIWGNNPIITGGTIDGAAIGATTPSTGAFTTISTTGTASLHDLSLTSQLTVANGGTGRTTLTNHAVLVGAATGAITQLAVGTTGQMLLGVSTSDPVWGNNPTITGGTIDGAVIGGTTPAAGSFTTVTATGTITPSQTNGIVGTTTNNNANAGSVGEHITATGTNVSLSSGAGANITSISLTAGDWDVRGNIEYLPAGGTSITQCASGANTVSATLPSTPNRSIGNFTAGAGLGQSQVVPTTRVSLSSTTTIFLVGFAVFTVSTCNATGFISARRVR